MMRQHFSCLLTSSSGVQRGSGVEEEMEACVAM
jgi:hypothetical protein